MVYSTATAGLPTSRTDALSVVTLGLVSAFIGATPGKGKLLALASTTLANMWAVISSMVTLKEVFSNPDDIEQHVWLVLIGLLVLTIVTSALTLVSFADRDSTISPHAFIVGMLVVLAVFVFSLVELLIAFATGCDQASLTTAALCKHSTGSVVGIVVGVSVSGLVCGCIITLCSIDSNRGVVQNAWMPERDYWVDDSPSHSIHGAILTRTSALTKACILGVLWWLVDGDLSWDNTVNGNDMNLWTTGQWAKQGAAIINNFLNCLV